MTRSRAFLGAFTAVSLMLGLSINASAQTVNSISGTQSPVEGACLGLLALFSQEDCSYDMVPFTTFPTTVWTGPTKNAGTYAPGTSPWEVNGMPDVNVVPTTGDNKVSLAISGSVTIENGADMNSCTGDETIAAQIVPASGVRAAGGGPGTQFEEYWSMGEVTFDLAAAGVDNATADGMGGCTYVIGSLGFPELLTYTAGGNYVQDIDSGAGVFAAPGSVGVASFEGDNDPMTTGNVGEPMTTTTSGGYNCIDQNSAACPGDAGVYSGTYSTLENTTWEVNVDATGAITGATVHGVNEFQTLNLDSWADIVWQFTGTCQSGCVTAGTANDDMAGTLQDTAVDIDVLNNDTGFNDPVTLTIDTAPMNGMTAFVGNNPGNQDQLQIRYTPGPGFTGQDTFIYEVDDGSFTDTATVTVDVQADLQPVAPDGNLALDTRGQEGAAAANSINVATLPGFNPGNTPSTCSIAAQPTNGTAMCAGTTVTVTPNNGFVNGGAMDTTDYQIDDGNGDMAQGTITVMITDVQPTLSYANIDTPANTAGMSAATVTPGNGTPAQHTISVSMDAMNGSCMVDGATFAVTYNPDVDYSGPDSCQVTLEDADADPAVATVQIVVTAVPETGSIQIRLPSSGSAISPWTLALLLGVPLLRRRRMR